MSEFTHPELQADEIFLLNVKDSENFGVPPFCISTRRGEIAYITGGGQVVPDMKPLFGKVKPVDMVKLKTVSFQTQLVEALLTYLENGKLLDLNEHSITADNGDHIYGFMRHDDKLFVLTPNKEYPINEIPDDVLQYILVDSKEDLDDVGTIYDYIVNKHYQTNSL